MAQIILSFWLAGAAIITARRCVKDWQNLNSFNPHLFMLRGLIVCAGILAVVILFESFDGRPIHENLVLPLIGFDCLISWYLFYTRKPR